MGNRKGSLRLENRVQNFGSLLESLCLRTLFLPPSPPSPFALHSFIHGDCRVKGYSFLRQRFLLLFAPVLTSPRPGSRCSSPRFLLLVATVLIPLTTVLKVTQHRSRTLPSRYLALIYIMPVRFGSISDISKLPPLLFCGPSPCIPHE